MRGAGGRARGASLPCTAGPLRPRLPPSQPTPACSVRAYVRSPSLSHSITHRLRVQGGRHQADRLALPLSQCGGSSGRGGRVGERAVGGWSGDIAGRFAPPLAAAVAHLGERRERERGAERERRVRDPSERASARPLPLPSIISQKTGREEERGTPRAHAPCTAIKTQPCPPRPPTRRPRPVRVRPNHPLQAARASRPRPSRPRAGCGPSRPGPSPRRRPCRPVRESKRGTHA